jgi:hypothetical protein
MSTKPKSQPTQLVLSDGKASLPKSAGTQSGKGRSTTSTTLTKIRFGSVTVEAKSPAKAEVRRNVMTGQFALERATSKMLKPGVVLAQSHGVPVYHADPRVPGRLVRELNGTSQPGTFMNGKFRPSK